VTSHRRLASVLAVLAVGLAAGCQPARVPAPRAAPVRLAGGDPLATVTHPPPVAPPGSVLTQRGDETRLGWNNAETRLTVASVRAKLHERADLPVDGKIYAQPLYAPGLVVVATEHDSVYAFDPNAGTGAAPLWKTSLLMPGATPFDAVHEKVGRGVVCDSVTPEVGINGTPVIDWTTRTLYAVALDVEHGTMTYRMHALDLATGRDLRQSAPLGGTVTGRALDTAKGAVRFNPRVVQQRMGLTLVNGILYAGFASWCGSGVYHGWVLGNRASDLTPAVVFNTSPDAYGGGLWESSGGITVDRHGHLVVVTGNGPYDLDAGGVDLGDSVLTLTPQDGTLRLADSFTPFDQTCRDDHDRDLGSGSPLAVPGHDEYILSSKTGSVYVLSAEHLGGYTAATGNPCTQQNRTDLDQIKQELTVDSVPGGMWGTWGYWHGLAAEYVYSSGSGNRLTQWRLKPDGTIDPRPVAQAPEAFAFPGAVPVTSSNRGAAGTGIVWTIDGDQNRPGVLRAYDAADIRQEIWHTELNGFSHFQVPTVAGGRVFVGGWSHLTIYGLD